MRTMTRAAVAAALVMGLLAACSSGPDPEAAKAAEAYSTALDAWSQELVAAAEEARTVTPAEREAAGEKGPDVDEVGIGEVLTKAPDLKKFDNPENTPVYLAATRVKKQVDAITDELAGLEPEALERLAVANYHSYYVLADVYYNTLGGPAADRRRIDGDAFDHLDDPAKHDAMLRDANVTFAKERKAIVETAIEEMQGADVGGEDPVIPEDGLGVSVGAFIVDWLREDMAFQDDAIEEMGTWKVLYAPYRHFWGHESINDVFVTPASHAAALRPAFAAQVTELAALLAEQTSATPAPEKAPALPPLAEPYRQVLLDGYLPWGDKAESRTHTMGRLWMLWRIRELEKTPDDAYTAARAAILEELNRGVDEGKAEDFRPGATRLLSLVGAYSEAYVPRATTEENTLLLAELEEVIAFGKRLRSYPMIAEVAADFDAALKLYGELNTQVAEALELGQGHQYIALRDLGEEYESKIIDVASPSLGLLDDDAKTEELMATLIKATAPS